LYQDLPEEHKRKLREVIQDAQLHVDVKKPPAGAVISIREEIQQCFKRHELAATW
jgi:hypothetical protein